MKVHPNRFYVCVVLLLTLIFAGAANGQLSANATVFATGLNNPRGLTFARRQPVRRRRRYRGRNVDGRHMSC